MKISLDWIKDYVPVDYGLDEFLAKMTMAGVEVETVENITRNYDNIIVGKVLEKEKHPNADKLSVCKVDTGSDVLQIVCGAKNVDAGQTVPVATNGAKIGDFKIKKTKLRGVESLGMICSEKELGLPETIDGIMVLNENEFKTGESLQEKWGFEQISIDLEITPNRPDLLSYIGLARETAIFSNVEMTKPDSSVKTVKDKDNESFDVDIKDSESCYRYGCRIIKNIKVKPSPKWVQERLIASGVRPINNIVDASNYIMLETGHPLHTFDLNKLEGKKIIVRPALKGEKVITLEMKEYELEESDLVIADEKKAIALAGVMGLDNSCIDDNTTDLLLECAVFSTDTVRKTSRKFKLFSESSTRFERGVDPDDLEYVIDRFCKMIADDDTIVLDKISDSYPNKQVRDNVNLRLSKLGPFLGKEISRDFVIGAMEKLELQVIGEKDDMLIFSVPSFRHDIERECDLYEEIARIYGYNNFPYTFPQMKEFPPLHNRKTVFRRKLKYLLAGCGLYEAYNITFLPHKIWQSLKPYGIDEGLNAPEIINPQSEDVQYLRTNLLTALLENVVYNYNHSNKNIKLFEMGSVYNKIADKEYNEREYLCLVLSGEDNSRHWLRNCEKYDFYYLKGLVEEVLNLCNINSFNLVKTTREYFHPHKSASILVGETELGYFGQIHPKAAAQAGCSQDVYYACFDIHNLLSASQEVNYKEVTRYPSIERDLALVMDEDILSSDLISILERNFDGIDTVIEIFDVYRGGQIDANKKSMAFNLKFSDLNRTLDDKEIDEKFKKLIDILKNKYNIDIRE